MQGKVVLITGGAKRVGAAICRKLHAAGANIVLHYRSSARESLALQEELQSGRPNSSLRLQADLLDPKAITQMVQEAIGHFGRLDALVNNASSFFSTSLDDVNDQNWNDLIGTNLKAPLLLAQAAAAELRRNHGAIVNIVDIHAERPMHGHLLYSIAKGGLAALTRALAQEMAPHVRVNAIAPGVIVWPESVEWSNETRRQEIVAHTLLKRQGEPDDIARTVQFLLNDAPYITGQIISVDGGRSINL
ncbi:MAG: pteridine reductase [Candidatus Nitrotoga sp.]|nr:pteridine reductase [Pseudomonadota bacterium]MDW7534653.1 pteridine reductase [Candidatus Nitrotoga sp.]MDW7604832.1 pteridine reductase [Candidatus Nitrotoga sp.]MDW7612805.1 pteridine reductase [Candidatus Nitrotoga sp.]MDW7625440.1 pteridine reductase [Candidatus Nitrotoga sp.]